AATRSMNGKGEGPLVEPTPLEELPIAADRNHQKGHEKTDRYQSPQWRSKSRPKTPRRQGSFEPQCAQARTRNPNNARSCDRPENPASGAANGTISCGGFDSGRRDGGGSQFRARSSSGGIRGSGRAHEHQPYVECWTRGYVQYWIRKICRADPHLGGARQAGSL